jgi:hypothetical protein
VKLPRLRTVLLTPFALFAVLYFALLIKFAMIDDSIAIYDQPGATHEAIAILGETVY